MNEIEELQGLESACRLCLTTDETRSSIFGTAPSLVPLTEKIQSCVSVQISRDDKLSTLICITCVNKVNQWHHYKELCLKSQDKLKEWLAKQATPISIVTVKKEQDTQESEESQKSPDKDKEPEEILVTDGPTIENEAPMEIDDTPTEESVDRETRGSSQQRSSKEAGSEEKPADVVLIKVEPPDAEEAEEAEEILETESSAEILLRNPLATTTNGKEDQIAEPDSTQKSASLSHRVKKKVRRGPHTHFRGARIFKRKCLYCQINLHSKTSYAKHMARFHSVVNSAATSILKPLGVRVATPEISEIPATSKPKRVANEVISIVDTSTEDAEELIEDVEEELENLGEDAPLTPVQQNIISQLKTFSCYSCDESFLDRRSTLNHIRQHMPDLRSYTCVACLTEFPDRSTYKQHCEASFECAMKIALVVPVQGTEKYFTCNMCLRPLTNRKDLLTHLSKHSDKQYEELMAPSAAPPKLTPMVPPSTSNFSRQLDVPGIRFPYGNGDPACNHECDLCGMIYRYKPNMTKHRELCASLKPEGRTSYKCVDCGMTFLVFSKFHSHVTIEHRKKELKCPKCAAKFRSPSDYLTHHEHHRIGKKTKEPSSANWNYKKQEGDEEVEVEDNLQHQQNKRRFSCNLCNLHFSSRAELVEHRNLHLKVKIYSCVICRSMFSSAGALEIHMKDHGIDDPTELNANSSCMEYGQEETGSTPTKNSNASHRKNECFECGKTFSNYANLRRHIRNAHEDARRIDCSECVRTFKNKESYEDHLRNAHDPEKTVLQCSQCPKTFVFQANLDLHRRNSHTSKPDKPTNHECDVCGKSFLEESSLKIHRGWHNRANSRFSLENYDKDRLSLPNALPSSSKPAKARKSFPNSSPVVHHQLQQQLQLLELQCQVCDDKFVDVSELRKHVWDVHCARATKVEKPFVVGDLQCELCTNIFPDQQSLESHMEWHERNPILSDNYTGKSFRCDVCDKYYSSLKILAKHKKLHKQVSQPSLKFQSLSMKRPTCNTCGRSFTAESSLKRHKAMSPECQSYFSGRLTDQEPRNSYQDSSFKKKPVTCHICKTVFPSMSILYQHKQLAHKVRFNKDRKSPSNECVPLASNEGVSCNVCGKQFPGLSNLKQHFTIKHKNVSQHPCTIANCKMIFSTSHALKNHELTHSNMIYSCSLCERHFFHKGAIVKHVFNAHKAIYQATGDKESLFKETDLSTYVVKGATGTVCPRCRIKYPNIKAMKIHYFKFHETFG